MSNNIRVILVEDDQDLADSIQQFLTLSGFAVTTVGSGLEYYQAIAANVFDVAVIDIQLPDQSGLVLAEYTHNNTQLAIIIITASDTIEMRVKSYGKGSDLFLSKPVDCLELEAAIKNLVARRHELSRENVGKHSESKAWMLERNSRSLTSPKGASVTLTAKEFTLLEQFVGKQGSSISRDHLLSRLYPRNDQYTSKSLDTLVSRTRTKLATISSPPSPLLSVYGIGYSFGAHLQLL